jgi:hypothetical protein
MVRMRSLFYNSIWLALPALLSSAIAVPDSNATLLTGVPLNRVDSSAGGSDPKLRTTDSWYWGLDGMDRTFIVQ